LAPYYRLQYKDQLEEKENQTNKAPKGSITIISTPLCADETFPKGFYLRCMNGVLWLRGYTSSDDYIFNPGDRIAFEKI